MFVITNMTDESLIIDKVEIHPHQQLSVNHLTLGMIDAKDAGTLRIMDGDETLAERKADTKAINDGISNMEKILNG